MILIEFNANTKHLDKQTKTCAEYDGLIQTPHGHITPSNFPLGHAGKIIFIERDTPAVVVSAFYFFQKLPFVQPYLEKHGINDDLQKFARFMMGGKLFNGTPDEYNWNSGNLEPGILARKISRIAVFSNAEIVVC